jgi:ribose 5-phosphate isomerase B
MKLAIGCDHAGYEYKAELIQMLESAGHEVMNFGTDTGDSVDYPDHVHPVASKVEAGDFDLGILICGSANGVCMTANKYAGIRAAIAWNTELAELARQHNNANIVCIPARFISVEEAKGIVSAFLATDFEGGRHATRVNKISIQ